VASGKTGHARQRHRVKLSGSYGCEIRENCATLARIPQKWIPVLRIEYAQVTS
jgi:hypothetical protein